MSTDAPSATADRPADGEYALPPMIDMGDALDRIERATSDGAALSQLGAVRGTLSRIARRPPGRRESLVNDLDNSVDSLRMHVADGGDADFWAETAQNRVANYRRTRRETSDTLHFGNTRLRVDGEAAVDPAANRGETGRLRGTLVNQAEPGEAIVQLAFYDDDGAVTWTVESCGFRLDAGERRNLDLHVWIPEDAAYYGVAALDADDPRATGAPPTRKG